MPTSLDYKGPMRSVGILIVLVPLLAMIGGGDDVRPSPERITVADGVYLFVSKPYGDVGLDGNSIAIVGNEAVLVFDTNGTPASAAQVLTQIRAITSRPVRY